MSSMPVLHARRSEQSLQLTSKPFLALTDALPSRPLNHPIRVQLMENQSPPYSVEYLDTFTASLADASTIQSHGT